MKISFFIDSLSAGGKERQLYYLISSLSAKYKLQLIVFEKAVFYEEIFKLPVEIILIDKKNRYSIKTTRIVFINLKAFKPDILHFWDNISQLIALPYIISYRPKIINGSIRYAGKMHKSITTKILHKLAFSTSHKIVGNSQQGINVEGLAGKKKSEVIYNGILLNDDDHSRTSGKDHLSGQLGKHKFNVVMVGRFFSAKDYITYIQAAKVLLSKKINIGFYCIGDGPKLEKAKKESGTFLNNGIFFLGKRDDVKEILHLFDIGVLLNNTAGHAEGISNAIMEYMINDIPVIATDAGGTPELVENGVSGFLVPAFDKDIVADKISELFNNEELMSSMGEQGKRIIQEKFSIEKMVSAYISLYEDLLVR